MMDQSDADREFVKMMIEEYLLQERRRAKRAFWIGTPASALLGVSIGTVASRLLDAQDRVGLVWLGLATVAWLVQSLVRRP